MRPLFATPPPKIVLLPASVFFVRAIEVSESATADAVAAQVDLALETLSPFPVTQMFYGYWWKAGAPRALVYAAYRRRFSAEEIESWNDAEWVIPEFVPFLALDAGRAQTLVLTTSEGVTTLHWGAPGPVPTLAAARAFPDGAEEPARTALREEAISQAGATVNVHEVSALPVLTSATGSSTWEFETQAGETAFTREEADHLDIRDKTEISARRRARARDLWLWRLFVGSVVVIALGLILQGGLIAGRYWEGTREKRIAARAPQVEAINRANDLATRIEELATRRLYPFEMIDAVKGVKPPSITFRTVTAQTMGRIEVTGTTSVSGDLPAFRSALAAQPTIERVEFLDQTARDNITTFRLLATFKRDAFQTTEPAP